MLSAKAWRCNLYQLSNCWYSYTRVDFRISDDFRISGGRVIKDFQMPNIMKLLIMTIYIIIEYINLPHPCTMTRIRRKIILSSVQQVESQFPSPILVAVLGLNIPVYYLLLACFLIWFGLVSLCNDKWTFDCSLLSKTAL